MNFLLISGVILSFLFSAIILFKKTNKSAADNILAIWLIFLGLDYLRSFFLFEENIMILLGFGYAMPAIDGPFLFMYVYTLTSQKNKFNRKLLYHLIPFLLFAIYLTFFIASRTMEERLVFFQETTFNTRPFLFNFFEILMILIVPVYIFLVVKLLKKHLNNINNHFSYKDKIDLRWINFLLVSVFVLWTLIFVIKLFTGYFNTLMYNDILLTVHYFELVIIVIVGYFGFKQEIILFILTDTQIQNVDYVKYKSTGLSEEKSILMKSRILEFMNKEKPYLISDLSLDKLAQLLEISPHHLSQIINGQLEKNFFEFVNEYRVEEVKRLISQNLGEKFTLLSIAHDSGFNSKSTFNSTFKKFTSLTPKEYMRSLNGS